jgi:hypothetical protein
MLDPMGFNQEFHNFEAILCPAVMANPEIRKEDAIGTNGVGNLDTYLPKILNKSSDYEFPYNAIAIDSPFSNKRLTAQHGRFTVHGRNCDSLHEQLEGCENERILSAFILKTSGKLQEFREQLYSLRVTEETIYQDLDSLVREIIRIGTD